MGRIHTGFMANPHLSTTLAVFEAVIHRNKNRLVAIPAGTQRALGLKRRRDNHIIAYSIRRAGTGRWNHHLAKLTYDNEFSIPSDVATLKAGNRVDVKIHRIIPDVPLSGSGQSSPADVLMDLAGEAGHDPRIDGSERINDYLRSDDAP
jgi:hypothetical protein